MALTVCEYCLISRSLRLPKIFLRRPEHHGRLRPGIHERADLACRRQGCAPACARIGERAEADYLRRGNCKIARPAAGNAQDSGRRPFETNLEMQVRPGRTAGIAGKPQFCPRLTTRATLRAEIFDRWAQAGREIVAVVDLDQIAVLRVPFRRDHHPPAAATTCVPMSATKSMPSCMAWRQRTGRHASRSRTDVVLPDRRHRRQQRHA